MAQADLSTLSPIFKTLYQPEAIKDIMYKNNPFLALVRKDEGFVGASSTEPLIYASSQNRSPTFSVAAVVNTTAQTKAFLLTRVSNYATAAIANEALRASESDAGAFLRVAKIEVDKALLSVSQAIATQLYRSGTGTIGRLSASATVNSASVYVQLANPEDIVNFEVNMPLAVSATDGGAARASSGCFIKAIKRSSGSFICSATVGGAAAALDSLITSPAASDYVYAVASDRNAVISGLKAWLPGESVTSSTFFNVDRTADPTRLAGVNYDGSASSIEEALIDGAALIAREGGHPDHCFMSFKDYRNLIKAMSSKQQFVQYVDVKVNEPKVDLSFSSLTIHGPNGPIQVIADKNAPAGSAYLLQMDTWTLRSLGELVSLFNSDGLDMIRDATSDNLLIRAVSYAQLSCRAPGFNGVITLPS